MNFPEVENHIYQCNRTFDSGLHLEKHSNSLNINLDYAKEKASNFDDC